MKSIFSRPTNEYFSVALSLFAVVSFLMLWFTR